MMAEDGAAGRLDALVLKLRHPLAKIRSRALQSLLFKLRERLVRWQELEPLHNSLVPALLASLEPPLELQALHVLQLLVQSQSELLVASLQRCGAAQTLQRAANSNAELRATYEKLLRQIYVTKVVAKEEIREQVSNSREGEEREVAAKDEKLRASMVLADRRRGPKVDELEARGWKFAQVTLASVDEQFLFEFEVKLQLRTETQDLVAACATFRNDLLRNFPAQVFLQRPVVLQYLLHLVQQPVLPGSPGTMSERSDGEADALVERAMGVSMGVNYFDEMLNSTFSSKRGNLSGAVVMASVKAIESFLYALKLTRKTCLDPTHVVHAPSVHVELLDSYDTRRVLYPRARVEVGDGVVRTAERSADVDQLEQYSLSGAVYKIFTSVLPLLRSARHPRLHLLNLLITALLELPEKGGTSAAEASIQELDKVRLERIFDVLGGICRPVVSEQGGASIIDPDLELTHSMTWKLVELVLRLLSLYPSSRYCVDTAPSAADTDKGDAAANSDVICVPRVLWEAVKSWAANPLLPGIAAEEWKDESLVQNLSKIDATIPAFVNLKHSSQQDAKMIIEFVEFARAHREQLTDFGPSEKKPSVVSLEVVQKAIQISSAFDSADAEAIADATLQAIWSTLSGAEKQKALSESELEAIRFILCDQLSGLGEKETLVVAHFFRGLVDLVNGISNEINGVSAERRRQFVNEILCEPKLLTLLLLVLARQTDGNQLNTAAFWEILRFALNQLSAASSDKLVQLKPVIPLLQHFAYIEPSEGSSPEQRSTQPQLAEVLNRVEASVPDSARHVLISRCLLHESLYIRKAAASGIIRLVNQTNPSALDWITKEKEIREDPFGSTFIRDDKRLTLDTTLMESPLPVIRNYDYQPSENELSSQLSKLTHLRKVISGTSSGFESMREAAFKELVMLIENAPVELFALFEELDKVSEFIDLVRTVLESEAKRKNSPMVQQALLLLRTLLLRSRLLRSAMQRDTDLMRVLLPLIFHSSAAIRTQMYYIILLMTCAAENFLPEGAPVVSGIVEEAEFIGEAKIPEMIKPTFGLYSDRWVRCFVGTCSLEQQLKASCTLLTKRADVSWLQEVKAIINQTPGSSSGASATPFSSLLDAEYTLIAEKVRDAPSHGKCLNALYHLLTLCGAWSFARERFVGEWEADFERYFAVPPKSERDEVIIGSLVNTLSVLFCSMTRGQQLRALVVVKRNILPLLKRSKSKDFSLQVARLLLNVSESKVGDLFLSLAADTDVIAIICSKYSAIYATEPVLHAVMLEVLLRFARPMDENADTRLSPPSREKICKRLTEMLSPLLSVVCRHRVPGSFMDRDVFVIGAQCMVAILRTLPRDSLLASDSPLQHTDSSILLDGSWASRFLFDHVSPIRELGFMVIEHSALLDPPSSRLLEMAFETSTDDTESDAVRAAACSVLTNELLQFDEYPPDRRTAMVEIFRGSKFAGRALRSLLNALKSPKLFARTASAFVRLVRVLYMQSESLAPQLGDIKKELEVAQEEYDIYPVLVQALSLREWKDNCNRYSSSCMLLPRCDDDAWRCSLLPAILDLMIELLNLLQAVCRVAGYDQVKFFLMHTTLQYQLMELVEDIHASFDDTLPKATKRKQYEVLDLCAGTLSILLVQSFDQHGQCDTKHFGAPRTSGFGASFVIVVEKLLEPHHPIDFRVSFSRVVPAITLLIPGSLNSSDGSVTNALCSAVFDLYQEVAEFRPLTADTATAAQSELQGRVFPLTSIRRVACALQVLLETSPSLQQFVQMKRGLPFALTSIKETFSAIRIAGGFGGKRARGNNSNTQDAYVLDLCGRIQTHMEVVSAIVGGHEENQRLAKTEGLLSVILANWNVMKAAHVRGSQLLLRALHLLANYVYGNDNARASMLVSLSSGSGKPSGGGTALLPLLFGLASSRGEVAPTHRQAANSAAQLSAEDVALSNAACQVLKAVMLNSECVLASVKTGSVSKMVDSLQDRLKQTRQTSKVNRLEFENLAHMLSVLSSIACSEEGARVLYTSWATVLSLVFEDTMHSTDALVRRSGCLLMRNLALSQATKNNFGMWEELLDEVVATSVRVSAAQGDSTALRYLSATLWSLVYDNQKARALLLSRPTALHNLQQVLASQESGSEQMPGAEEIVENLRRVLMLVQE